MVQKITQVLFIYLLCSLAFSTSARERTKPALMLANVYHKGINLNQYWVSEKYDGVRALWDGKKFISRGGNRYVAPIWFTKDFPAEKLDGELWIARQQFELTVSTVRDQQPDHEAWTKIKFMVFDMPDIEGTFDRRLIQLNKTVKSSDIVWLEAVKQWKVKDHKTLLNQLDEITAQGAEGLMLHRGDSLYKGKRSGDLLKVKQYQDAEATVIGHIAGKGKYKKMLGAILVEMPNQKHFKIGTGFSDRDRRNPPKIGQTITYQYRGMTKNGIPRFASYLRERKK